MENIDIAGYADDNTPCTTANSIQDIIQKLKKRFNPDNCYFSCSSNMEVILTVKNQKIKNPE